MFRLALELSPCLMWQHHLARGPFQGHPMLLNPTCIFIRTLNNIPRFEPRSISIKTQALFVILVPHGGYREREIWEGWGDGERQAPHLPSRGDWRWLARLQSLCPPVCPRAGLPARITNAGLVFIFPLCTRVNGGAVKGAAAD